MEEYKPQIGNTQRLPVEQGQPRERIPHQWSKAGRQFRGGHRFCRCGCLLRGSLRRPDRAGPVTPELLSAAAQQGKTPNAALSMPMRMPGFISRRMILPKSINSAMCGRGGAIESWSPVGRSFAPGFGLQETGLHRRPWQRHSDPLDRKCGDQALHADAAACRRPVQSSDFALAFAFPRSHLITPGHRKNIHAAEHFVPKGSNPRPPLDELNHCHLIAINAHVLPKVRNRGRRKKHL